MPQFLLRSPQSRCLLTEFRAQNSRPLVQLSPSMSDEIELLAGKLHEPNSVQNEAAPKSNKNLMEAGETYAALHATGGF